jgi:hypothetical protein
MNVLDAERTPRVMGLREVLRSWLDHRHVVLVRRSEHRLAAIARRLEILDGYLRWRKQFCDDQGELLPRFRPPPMMPTFMSPRDPESTLRTAIPVPKGPVEVW